jgi:hypothetical protein
MLHIMIALGAASPLLLESRVVIAVRFWIRAVFHLALALTVAVLIYFALLLALVQTYPIDRPSSTIVYGCSFAITTIVAAAAGTLVSPAPFLRFVTPAICALAVMFPIGLYIYFGMTGAWRATYLLYITGSIAGACGVTRLSSWPRLYATSAT